MEILLLVIAAVVAATVILRRQRYRTWRRLARRYRLTYRPDPSGRPRVTGSINGRPCRLAVSNESSDTGIAAVEVVELTVEARTAAPPDLEITEGTSVDPLVGVESVATGDSAFDERLRVTGQDPEAIRAYLTPDRRRAILHLFEEAAPDHVVMKGEEITVRRRRAVSRLETIEADLALLLDTANRLENPRTTTEGVHS
ncbi:MAG TPA: hypothetical protein VLT32_24415 [Candidatus Sulfomarinibacteraceae bacterium]|nr:hypothetical protein [Candidatus Sulfomarinibacteraceae bacterium]